MGTDKAWLEIAGQPLIRRMLAIAGSFAPAPKIVGSAEKFHRFAEVVEDVFAGCGPLAGIHAALRASHSDLNLILAVDMPFVPPEFLRYLADQAAASRALATVPLAEGRWQPLCAMYRRAFAEVAERALREGKYKIDPLFRLVQTRSIEEGELAEHGFTSGIFRNLNTPDDVQAVLSEGKPYGTAKPVH
jgi:molybdopterin-guanine dinucleotide biosynthesis protein A